MRERPLGRTESLDLDPSEPVAIPRADVRWVITEVTMLFS